jgi:hypothetical protein
MKKMTISQALRRRKKLKGEISTQAQRVQASLTYNKEDAPAFPFSEAQKAHRSAKIELIELETSVAEANAKTKLDWKGRSVSLAWVLRVLSELKDDINRYEGYRHYGLLKEREVTVTNKVWDEQNVIATPQANGRVLQERVMKEVSTTTVSNVTIKECEDKVTQLKDEFDKLNDLLETANHRTEVSYQDQWSEEEKEG